MMKTRLVVVGLSIAMVYSAAACGGGENAGEAPATETAAPAALTEGTMPVTGFNPDTGGPVDLNYRDPVLIGAIDFHAHLDPDMAGGGQTARAEDVIDEARRAKMVGQRGFVYKTHMDMGSAAGAMLAREEVPGVEVFGRFALNLPVGGINPTAVVHYANIKGGWGRVIEMPTRDQNLPEKEGRPWVMPWIDMPWSNTVQKWVPVSRNGQLLPDVKLLISLLPKIKTQGSNGMLTLATGHASPENHLLIAQEAIKQGVNVLLTHPGDNVDRAAAAKMGAYVEVMADINQYETSEADTAESADADAAFIKSVGAEQLIMGTDCGQMDNPFPSDCMVSFARAMRARGISEAQLNLMYKINPAKFLGLPAPPAETVAGN